MEQNKIHLSLTQNLKKASQNKLRKYPQCEL